jgi:tagatose-1,6-bisphosphate aldolase
MDKVTEDLNKASHVLLDAEVQLKQVQAQRLQIEKEIAMLNMIEANLTENIRVLRRKRVIVMVTEFRKVITDLNTVRTRLAFLRVDSENVLKIERHTEIVYEKLKADYEKFFNRIHNPQNNVLQFRRPNGRQD